MIVIDTSIWADHFRNGEAHLAVQASDMEIVQHPFVTGELAMGNLRHWRKTVNTLDRLPRAAVLDQAELLDFIEANELMGTGVGFVDSHLLGTCARDGHLLWTRDKRLMEQAERLGLLHTPG